MKTLADLQINKSGKIISISGQGATRQHLLDMGIIPGTVVQFIKLAPLGDPMEFKLRGYSLTLRKNDAKTIAIEDCPNEVDEVVDIKKNVTLIHPLSSRQGK